MDAPPLAEDELNQIYNWVDEIPLSRPKKNIARDFSDGVLVAEIVHHFLPKFVEIHNYSPAHSSTQKNYNWNTLNRKKMRICDFLKNHVFLEKVFKKIGFQLSKNDVDHVINCVPDAIERVLKVVQVKLEKYLQKKKDKPFDDQPLNTSGQNEQNSKNNQGYGVSK